MIQLNQVVTGFLFGVGFILASLVMRLLFHVQVCG